MPARLTSRRFQPTMARARSAFTTCFHALHEDVGTLDEEDRFDCFAEVGIRSWHEVPDLDDATTVALAEAVQARMAA